MRERFAGLRVLRIVPGRPGTWQRQDGLSVPLTLGPFVYAVLGPRAPDPASVGGRRRE
jgi:hypothetical protein